MYNNVGTSIDSERKIPGEIRGEGRVSRKINSRTTDTKKGNEL